MYNIHLFEFYPIDWSILLMCVGTCDFFLIDCKFGSNHCTLPFGNSVELHVNFGFNLLYIGGIVCMWLIFTFKDMAYIYI